MSEVKTEVPKKSLNTIVSDLTRPLKNHYGFKPWIILLLTIMIVGLAGYIKQLNNGLVETSMRDYVSWGLYISSFIFFIATALIGMLISAVLGLIGIKWITPIARIAEMIALGFAMWAGLIIIFDMGRPDRVLNLFIHGRLQSPIVWDVTVVTTYVAISLLLYILPLIPDMPFLKKAMKDDAKWKQTIYKILSFGFEGRPEQYKLIKKLIRILAILIIPVALAIHTVTSWLFAFTLRVGWDSTIFGPYYVTGAFVAGGAAVMVAMYIFRTDFRLKNYITDYHFDKMGKLLVLLMLVYFYFNINEYIVPAYKMKSGDDHHILALFTGSFAKMFWIVQLGGLIIPTFLLLFKRMRKPLPSLFIGIAVVLGAFFKRYIITIPTLMHPHLPIQNVPADFHEYWPTAIEWAVTGMAIAGAILIVTILAKLFPIMPIWEIAHEEGISEEEMKEYVEKA
jgi:molybdopterin-containing oxidoreductase family membrane subunit